MTGSDLEGEIGLEQAFALKGPEDNRRLYARWADSYEDDFVAVNGYIYHRQVATVFAKAVSSTECPPSSVAVLDVGCGTGIVGEELKKLGVQTIDGIDISSQMLDQASRKQHNEAPVYRNLIEADLTKHLEIADDTYTGLISAGAFTHGHLGPESLIELMRVTTPGGPCAIGINAAHFKENGFERQLDQFVDDGTIGNYRLLSCAIYDSQVSAPPASGDHATALIAVFSIAGN